MRSRLPIVAALCFIIGLAIPAGADTITLFAGVAQIGFSERGYQGEAFNLSGNDFHAFAEHDGPPTSNTLTCVASACAAGTVLTLGSVLNPADTVGFATLGGTTYSPTQYTGHLTFSTGDVILPSLSDFRESLILQSAFTVRALLDISQMGGSGPFSVGTVDLTGLGVATGFFSKSSTGFTLDSVTYDFLNPTPEPGSLVLLATGVAMALGKVRARRRL